MRKNNGIKNIIFDFGGVIIDIDFWLSINAFIRLGAENFHEVYSQSQQSGLFDELDKGTITAEEFCKGMAQYLPADVTTKQIIDAWNAILIGIPEHRIRLLESIRKHYRIFLLSNTNAIHYPEYVMELKHKYGYNDLSELFEKVYLSFEVKLRKPDTEIFKKVLIENGLTAEETLFIDDSEQNLPPAEELGMRTLFLQKNEDVSMIFIDGYLKV
ncbi:MAG: HAD family phosphatase [Bacteroidota bacterium]